MPRRIQGGSSFVSRARESRHSNSRRPPSPWRASGTHRLRLRSSSPSEVSYVYAYRYNPRRGKSLSGGGWPKLPVEPGTGLRDALRSLLFRPGEKFEGDVPVEAPIADGAKDRLELDRPPPERQVEVPRLPVALAVVVGVDEGEPVPDQGEELERPIVVPVEGRVADVEARLHPGDPREDLREDRQRLLHVLQGDREPAGVGGVHELCEPRRADVERDPRRGPW